MALNVIKLSGIDTSGNYTVNGMNVPVNMSKTLVASIDIMTVFYDVEGYA
jgi:hypothetical protein